MHFVSRSDIRSRFEGKAIVIVGSGPSSVENPPGFIDSHDVVVRVNNYKVIGGTGRRTDVHYSFYGNSIRKSAADLKRDGVTLCMCKCPDVHAIESEWHRRNGKMSGVDFRWIYEKRAAWWFCDTFIPAKEEFLAIFDLLGGHIPTTGFASILESLSFNPAIVYLTGFDFFRSGTHNVDEPWRQKNNDDPVGHAPERELAWLAKNIGLYPIQTDSALMRAMESVKVAA